jgi:hypothetical protein
MKRDDHLSRPALQPWARVLIAASLMLALSLLAAASLPISAPAMTPESTQLEAEVSGEESEEGEEESESEEAEEGEEEFGSGRSLLLPAACVLRSAEPDVTVQFGPADVRLTLRYEAEEPTRAGIEYWLKGSKGSLQLGFTSHRLSTHGAIRLNSRLDEREMAKARAARAFLVDVDVPETPSYCARYLTLRLTAKHLLAKRETWSLPLERRAG